MTKRSLFLKSVLAPTGEILFFACPRQLLHALPYLLHPCSRKKSIEETNLSGTNLDAKAHKVGTPGWRESKDTRIPSLSCASRFLRGFSKGRPWPYENERLPCRSPLGLFAKSCDARDGITGLALIVPDLTSPMCMPRLFGFSRDFYKLESDEK